MSDSATINVAGEDLLSIRELAAKLPRSSPEQVRSWLQVGMRGIKLESVKIGGRRYTSWEAYLRFNQAVNGKN
jgi:hypothetical protein